ncbi:hypothetical protein F4774DRAFT_396842 [Daldinia eschscholtzii]|nr:hypothetical protein F4774DRAFT_396842 [Daldinia eschscholtzii]
MSTRGIDVAISNYEDSTTTICLERADIHQNDTPDLDLELHGLWLISSLLILRIIVLQRNRMRSKSYPRMGDICGCISA